MQIGKLEGDLIEIIEIKKIFKKNPKIFQKKSKKIEKYLISIRWSTQKKEKKLKQGITAHKERRFEIKKQEKLLKNIF